jgi:ferredoxin-NADP reductase
MYVKPTMKQIVGIAGGIGITPFRALIKAIASGTTNTKLTLIYSAVGSHTYKSEFETTLVHPNIEIIYTSTPEEVNEALEKQVALHQNNAHYFISGSPRMIEALKTTLLAKRIRNIVNDSFKGY